MNPSNSSTGSHFNPFLKHATNQNAGIPQQQQTSAPVNTTTPFAGGVQPFTPSSSTLAPPPVSSSPFPNSRPGLAPPPVSATPFIPRSTNSSVPPPSSIAPPPMSAPPIGPPSAMTETPDMTANQGYSAPVRNRKPATAAQLYSVCTMENSKVLQQTQETQQSKETIEKAKEEVPPGPQKPSNSNDRINLNRIPHPEEDNVLRRHTLSTDDDYMASVPFPTHQITYIDNGNSSLRYMRPTNRVIPHTYYMYNKTRIPCSVLFTPFAEPGPQEEPVPVLDGTNGLVRCNECSAYMNPHCKFTHDGHSYICNICQTENTVPSWYYSTLDMNGVRNDRLERPELSKGTVEYRVGKEFLTRPPQKPVYAFVIDISKNAHTNGVLAMVLSSIRACVELLNDNEDAKIGICIFDIQTHLLTIRNGHIHEIMMTDTDDAYAVTAASSWLLSPTKQEQEINQILDYISSAYSIQVRQPSEHAATFAAIKTVAGALAYSGGHMIVIECTPPMIGLGRISSTENLSFYGTDDESTLYLCSKDEIVYDELGTACCFSSVCIDFIVACREHVHLAEQQILADRTGGSVYLCNEIGTAYTNSYLTEIHGYIQNLVLKQHNWDAVMKLRVSNGLTIESVSGHCIQNDDDEVVIPLLDNHTTIEFVFDLPKYLNEKDVYLQLAILYTTEFGERRIRLFNQRLLVTETYSQYFKGIDGYAIMMSLMRTASIQTDNTALPEICSNMKEAITEALLQYRVQCSSNSSTGQLVLPENGKLLPLLLNCCLKSPMLIFNEVGKRELYNVMPRGDVRANMISFFTQCDAIQFMNAIYPSLYQLDPVNSWGIEDDNGFISKPDYLFLTSSSLDLSAIYLFSCLKGIIFIVGNQVDPSLLMSLFGVQSIPNSTVAAQLTLLPEGDDYCNRVNVLVNDLQNRFGCYLQPRVVVRGTPEASQVLEMMTEDAMRKSASFSEFLMHMHSEIISGV